jgi:hypothetical protein
MVSPLQRNVLRRIYTLASNLAHQAVQLAKTTTPEMQLHRMHMADSNRIMAVVISQRPISHIHNTITGHLHRPTNNIHQRNNHRNHTRIWLHTIMEQHQHSDHLAPRINSHHHNFSDKSRINNTRPNKPILRKHLRLTFLTPRVPASTMARAMQHNRRSHLCSVNRLSLLHHLNNQYNNNLLRPKCTITLRLSKIPFPHLLNLPAHGRTHNMRGKTRHRRKASLHKHLRKRRNNNLSSSNTGSNKHNNHNNNRRVKLGSQRHMLQVDMVPRVFLLRRRISCRSSRRLWMSR